MLANLRRPTDLSSLVFFRIMAGLLLAGELLFALSLGDFHEYAHPGFHFTYQGFSWVRPLPEFGMKVLFGATITAGVFVSLGLYYRIATVVLFTGYNTLFLMEASQYVNHFYLYCLIAFWLMLLPLHRNGSLDTFSGRVPRLGTLPGWMLHLLQFQIAVVYVFAGIAKLHPDWVSGRMTGIFLGNRGIDSEILSPLMTWGGLLFDLLIIPLLLWRKTRVPSLIVAATFHLINVALFGLGTFPWFAFFSLFLFLPPGWPRRVPYLRKIYFTGEQAPPTRSWALGLAGVYVLIQILLPLRQHLYPHDASWSEEGHNYSWRMKTRTKRAHVSFVVENIETGHRWEIRPQDELTPTQYQDLGGNSEFILQFAQEIAMRFEKRGMVVAVYARSRVSLNAYPPEELVDPRQDLVRESRGFGAYTWIKPWQGKKRTFAAH